MPKYKVLVKEVYFTPVYVEADSVDEAISIIENNGGEWDEEHIEWEETLDSNEWKIGVENEHGITPFHLVRKVWGQSL